MDNQHRKITGYRELNQREIDLINQIKALGVELERLTVDIEYHVHQQIQAADDETKNRHSVSTPLTWLAKGKTDLQVGLMEITRSVAQPTSF